jgi:glycosyltransferase involved in cell wall biosynthesis
MSTRLLLLTPDYPPRTGGVARYLSAFASYFDGRIQVVVPPHLKYGTLIGELWRRRTSYDMVVVSHVLPVGTAAHAARALTFKPYVVIVHGMDVGLAQKNRWKKWIAGHVMRSAKLVIANSQALEREVREVFGVKRTAVAHPPAVGLQPAHPQTQPLAEHAPAARLRPGSPSPARRQLTVLTVARLVERKGHLRVLKAIAECREVVGEYHIVGSGPMEQAIRDEAKRLGLQDIVKLETVADDAAVARAYENADVFVMPTVGNSADREGFGMAYLEAAEFGVPSIASDVPGVDEAVLDGETGILVPDGDHHALVAALRKLADPKLRETLGENAKLRAHRDFKPIECFGPLEAFL